MALHDEQLARVRAVQDKYASLLLQLPQVVGVSIGHAGSHMARNRDLALVVLVDHKRADPQLDPKGPIPDQLEGVPVVVREVGSLKAQEDRL